MYKHPIEFRKIRDFGEIIGDTFLFIRQNFKPLFKSFFSIAGLFILASMVSAVIAQLHIAEAATNATQGSDLSSGFLFGAGTSYIVMLIFMLLSYTATYATVLSYIALYVLKGNVAPTVQEVWAYFRYYFFRVTWSGIVMFLFTVICFLFCLLPGIWVMPAVSIFFPIMVLENANLSYSFDRSFKLVNNEWWITFATLFVIYLITQAFSVAIQLPAIVIGWASAFTHLEQPITKTYAIATGIASSLSQVLLIVPTLGASLIYFNLVERKEQRGLLDRIDQFGESKSTDHLGAEEY